MKPKKQKLPSKPRTIDEITGKPSRFKKLLKELSEAQQKQHSESLREILNAADKAWKKVSGCDSKKRKSLLEHAKKLSKPAHTEVFEGYGVMLKDPKGQKLLHGNGRNPFFTQIEIESQVLAAEWRKYLKLPVEVVKIRAEFEVI